MKPREGQGEQGDRPGQSRVTGLARELSLLSNLYWGDIMGSQWQQ